MLDSFKIIVFNVGQGDHILIEFPEGDFGIIDFYYTTGLNFPNHPPVITYFQKIRENTGKKIPVRFIHISHFDNDHIKGIKLFLDWAKTGAEIGEIIFPGDRDQNDQMLQLLKRMIGYMKLPKSDNRYLPTLQQIKSRTVDIQNYLENGKGKTKSRYVSRDNSLTDVHSSLQMLCVAPDGVQIRAFNDRSDDIFLKFITGIIDTVDDELDRNLLSTIILLRCREDVLRLFFGGDASKNTIEDSLEHIKNKTNWNAESVFIKAAHHGSKKSSSEKIWKDLVSNKYLTGIAISAGNGYGHPHGETIKEIGNNLTGKNVEIFATNMDFSTNYEERKIPWNLKGTNMNLNRNKSDARPIAKPINTPGISNKFIGYSFEFHFNYSSSSLFKVYKLIAE